MKRIVVAEDRIWTEKDRQYDQILLEWLCAKDLLIVSTHGSPPYEVVFGVPHQAAIGDCCICENGARGHEGKRPSDENAASYALVAFSGLAERDIPCKLAIVAHSSTADPNKEVGSPYMQEIFSEGCKLLVECHGAGPSTELDLELSAGCNRLSETTQFGERLFCILRHRYSLGAQTQAGSNKCLIFWPSGEKTEGQLRFPANRTTSLVEAEKRNIPALHLEAKPRFRRGLGGENTVTDDGIVLGHGLAQTIIKGPL